MAISKKAFAAAIKDHFPSAMPSQNSGFTIKNVNGEGIHRTYQRTSAGTVEARNYRDNWVDQQPDVFEEEGALWDDLLKYAADHHVHPELSRSTWRGDRSTVIPKDQTPASA